MGNTVDITDLFGKVEGLEARTYIKQRGPSWGDRGRVKRAEQNATIAAMYAAEEYISDIAEEVGLSVNTVSHRIQGMIAYWRKKGLESISERQAQHLAGLDALEQELLSAWQESREGKMTKVSEKIKSAVHNMHRKNRRNGRAGLMSDPDAAGEQMDDTGAKNLGNIKAKKYSRLESSPGDPRYMALILDIRKERAKIWGLYAKSESGGPGNSYDPQELAKLDKGQLLARFMSLVENVKLERARKLSAGVEVDISPEAIVAEGRLIAAQAESSGEDEF